MTDNHGETPSTTTTDWTTPQSKQDKKKAYHAKIDAFLEKKNQNDPSKPKIGAIPGVIFSPRNATREVSNFITRINFKVVPQKITKALSVLYNTITILAAIQAADPLARIVVIDHEGNEKAFYGAKTVPPENKETQDFIKQFVEDPRITKRNELVGLFTLRSDISFRDIKKNPTTQQLLNELPRIFLTQNNLAVVTPILVGFFVNHYPRPDKPEVFENYVAQIIKEQDENIKYQIDFGPVWAKNRKMSVYKLMSSQQDKEQLRTIMSNHGNVSHDVQYICASEYYSLGDQDKSKIVLTQLEFMNNTRSIFIEGYKTIQCELRMNAMNEKEEGDEGEEEDNDIIATWILKLQASNGDYMFTRIHEAVYGLVELYTTPTNHKEAIDWARLATSEIAKELNDESMAATFLDIEEAENALATNPDWTPHTLAKRIENLAPSATTYQPRRRQPVAISYATSNTEQEEVEKKQPGRGKRGNNNTTSTNPNATTKNTNTQAPQTSNAWMVTGKESKQENLGKTATPPKLGVNKYKAATAAQDSRMDKIEERIEAIRSERHTTHQEHKQIAKLQEEIQKITETSTWKNNDERFEKMEKDIAAIAKAHKSTSEVIKSVAVGQGATREMVKTIADTVKNNKIQADQDHKIMTDAMKSFQDSLVASQTMICALQRGQQASNSNKQERESPIRKKRAIVKNQESRSEYDSDESSFNSTKMSPPSEASPFNKSIKSDTEMDGAAGEE